MVNTIKQSQKDKYMDITSTAVELTEAEIGMVVIRLWREKQMKNCCSTDREFQSRDTEKF